MNRNTKRFLALALCLVVTLTALCGCDNVAKEAKKLQPGTYSIRVAGGPEGSEEEALAQAIVKALKAAGFGAKVITTSGGAENIQNISEYKAGLAIVSEKELEAAQADTQMLMALGASADGSRNVVICVNDMEDALAWLILSAFADNVDALQAAADGTQITMAEGNTVTPVPLQAGAAAYFKKQPWK